MAQEIEVKFALKDRHELVRFWPVIHNMIVQELRLRYHRSVLGFLWTLVHPIMMMATLSVVFSLLFTWLLSQRFTDTLCGTKALARSDYARLKAGRDYFGRFDPFGDFDLIFGASKLGLKAVEIPIRYASRTYGETQISRFRHGFMLLRMVLFAFMRIKAM